MINSNACLIEQEITQLTAEKSLTHAAAGKTLSQLRFLLIQLESKISSKYFMCFYNHSRRMQLNFIEAQLERIEIFYQDAVRNLQKSLHTWETMINEDLYSPETEKACLEINAYLQLLQKPQNPKEAQLLLELQKLYTQAVEKLKKHDVEHTHVPCEDEFQNLKEDFDKTTVDEQAPLLRKRIQDLQLTYRKFIQQTKEITDMLPTVGYQNTRVDILDKTGARILELVEMDLSLKLQIRKNLARRMGIPYAFLSPRGSRITDPVIVRHTGLSYDRNEIKTENLTNYVPNRALKNIITLYDEHKGFSKTPWEDMICSITTDPFTTPVTTINGFTYQNNEIRSWLTNHNSEPMTNAQLPDKKFCVNLAIKQVVIEFTDFKNALDTIDRMETQLHSLEKESQEMKSTTAKDPLVDQITKSETQLKSIRAYLQQNPHLYKDIPYEIKRVDDLLLGFENLCKCLQMVIKMVKNSR